MKFIHECGYHVRGAASPHPRQTPGFGPSSLVPCVGRLRCGRSGGRGGSGSQACPVTKAHPAHDTRVPFSPRKRPPPAAPGLQSMPGWRTTFLLHPRARRGPPVRARHSRRGCQPAGSGGASQGMVRATSSSSSRLFTWRALSTQACTVSGVAIWTRVRAFVHPNAPSTMARSKAWSSGSLRPSRASWRDLVGENPNACSPYSTRPA